MNGFQRLYATPADFCEAFQTDMDRLYLLAFLLTGSHALAESSFVGVMDEMQRHPAIFKPNVSSWIRRMLIKHVIRNVAFDDVDGTQRPDAWFDTSASSMIETVTKLARLERMVFVLCTLEGYSVQDCALLLDGSPDEVRQAEVRALRQLGELANTRANPYEFLRAAAS